ncbi:serine/threonine protein kinase [Rubinisphaera italica]|uniref:Serine/threonine-protein kinase PknB n=1 Tax=Rubinisphaera italica TaxID=2527969 RepID=A0A5C5XLM8_9PLAN|nr:serine/threonine-protein kinase [Rubinisphaera italica]TWT63303.1 Serine/threonine-protein kinase PknB [Rubinisphaera italica]
MSAQLHISDCAQQVRLLKQLRRFELLDENRIRELEKELLFNDVPQTVCLKQLVGSRELTSYQINKLLQEEADQLVLGNYLLKKPLGAGGMGEVYLAEHRRMQREVALKVLAPKFVQDEEMRLRFQREIQAIGRLSHPNIVTAFDADESDGSYFLVMEYVAGADLAALVQKNGAMSVSQVMNCILHAAHGLDYAHREGVIHRDIKPQNLLLTRAGQLKILDLGLARLDQKSMPQESLTETGSMMGTVDFMAPEQAMNAHMADARSDIYSLGCTLFYLLTGTTMYSETTLVEKLFAHRDQPIPDLPMETGHPLNAIYQKMVAKNPEDRFQSMHEVVEKIELLIKNQQNSETVLFPGVFQDSDFEPIDRSNNRRQNLKSTRVDHAAKETVKGKASMESTVLIPMLLTYDMSSRNPLGENADLDSNSKLSWLKAGLIGLVMLLVYAGMTGRFFAGREGSPKELPAVMGHVETDRASSADREAIGNGASADFNSRRLGCFNSGK